VGAPRPRRVGAARTTPGAMAAPCAGQAVPGHRARHAEPGQERRTGRGGGPRRGRVARDARVVG
jgi:hypothetical protein